MNDLLSKLILNDGTIVVLDLFDDTTSNNIVDGGIYRALDCYGIERDRKCIVPILVPEGIVLHVRGNRGLKVSFEMLQFVDNIIDEGLGMYIGAGS